MESELTPEASRWIGEAVERLVRNWISNPTRFRDHAAMEIEIAWQRGAYDGQGHAHTENRALVEKLRELLREYGRHSEGCNAAFGSYPCKCGWSDFEKEGR